MKKSALLVLSLLTMPVFAQSLWTNMNEHKASLPRPAGSSGQAPTGAPATTAAITTPSVSNQSCNDQVQRSMPYFALTALIQSNDGKFEVSRNAQNGTVTIKTPSGAPLVGNCASMLDFNMETRNIEGENTYSVKADFAPGTECGADGKCKFQVKIVENGEFKRYENMSFEPSLAGFEACMRATKVVIPDPEHAGQVKVDTKAIYNEAINETFNAPEAGDLRFVSIGPASANFNGVFGEKTRIGCNYYEILDPNRQRVLTAAQEASNSLAEEIAALRTCNDVDQILSSEAYRTSTVLQDIVKTLVENEAKDAAKLLADGEDVPDQAKILENFQKIIVDPLIEDAKAIYERLQTASASDKPRIQEDLTETLNKIRAYNRAPYFTSATVEKLLADGKFEDAAIVNSLKLSLDSYGRLGTREGNVTVSPRTVTQRIQNGERAFARHLETKRSDFSVTTGETTGLADSTARDAARYRSQVIRRSATAQADIQELQRKLQSGYCNVYYRNATSCTQEIQAQIALIQERATHNNTVDTEEATRLEAEAIRVAGLEHQGRRYVAAQNGEEIADSAVVDPNVAANAEMMAQAQVWMQQQQMQQQQQQQQVNPAWGVQNPMLQGQFNGQFQMQGGLQQQQYGYPQQQNFMGQGAYYNQMGMNPQMYQNGQMGMQGLAATGMNWMAYAQQQQQGQGQMYPNPYSQQAMMYPQQQQGFGFQLPQVQATAQFGLFGQ